MVFVISSSAPHSALKAKTFIKVCGCFYIHYGLEHAQVSRGTNGLLLSTWQLHVTRPARKTFNRSAVASTAGIMDVTRSAATRAGSSQGAACGHCAPMKRKKCARWWARHCGLALLGRSSSIWRRKGEKKQTMHSRGDGKESPLPIHTK